MTSSTDHLFAGAVRLRVHGPAAVLRHVAAEYGESAVPPGDSPPDVEVGVRWGRTPAALPGATLLTDRHKTARWSVALGPPDAGTLRAELALTGGPRSVTLSLVQGWLVEALVAVALARAGRVALPAAAFAGPEGATVLLGRSGAGKTTLTARALAAGRTVLSDDQVVLDPDGGVWRYPRRLRFYPDIEQTAPDAWTGLAPATRRALRLRGRVQRLTRGYVAPSLAVPATEIGPTVERQVRPLRRVVVVDRSDAADLVVTPRTPEWVVEQAVAVLSAQRSRLAAVIGGPWPAALGEALAAERRGVAAALGSVPATEVVVPRAWTAVRSLAAIEAQLEVTPGGAAPPADPSPAAA